MKEKKPSWEVRVEKTLKESLEVQRKILEAITSGSLESRVEIHPGIPRFYAKTSLPHDCHHHHHGHKNHHSSRN